MALTVSTPGSKQDVWGRKHIRMGTVTFDSSYNTGGEAIAPKDFELSEIDFIFAQPVASGYVVQPAADNSTLLVYRQSAATSALTEIDSTHDLSALVVNVLVIGL